LKALYRLAVILFFFPFSLSAQQVLDSIDVTFFDNSIADSNECFLNTSTYREFIPINPGPNDCWWSDLSHAYFFGNGRREFVSNGDISEVHAQFYCSVDTADYYLLYNYAYDRSSDLHIKLYKKNELMPFEDFHYNPGGVLKSLHKGSWTPVAIFYLTPGDSALTVDISTDSSFSKSLKVDGVALVRSRLPDADLEFGLRKLTYFQVNPFTGDTTANDNFYRDRFPLFFDNTIFSFDYTSTKTITLFNLGTTELNVTNLIFSTPAFKILNGNYFTIQPGTKRDVVFQFNPPGEGYYEDSLLILSNDPKEPAAILNVAGNGIPYQFILNASENNSEPNWNVPGNSGIYYETGIGWQNVTPFFIPFEQSTYARKNDIFSPDINCYYEFDLLDTLSGNYFVEKSYILSDFQIIHRFLMINTTTTDTLIDVDYSNNDSWGSTDQHYNLIGGSSFNLQPGHYSAKLTRFSPAHTSYLITDILRIRKYFSDVILSTSEDPLRILNFGSVSTDSEAVKELTISSIGTGQLLINSMTTTSNYFNIVDDEHYPIKIAGVIGVHNVKIKFSPSENKTYTDTLTITTNCVSDDSILTIVVYGNGILSGVDEPNNIPKKFCLYQNYPNPFNPSTKIRFDIPNKEFVNISVYDILGRKVEELINKEKPAGKYELNFDGGNLSSGVYFYKIKAGSFNKTNKFILLR